jgi:putative FmdB family regulatory protein
MPSYQFHCKKCECYFEELCTWEESKEIKCQLCKSKRIERVFGGAPSAMFKNPKESSKWDNFEYRAGYNMEQAKSERRAAEAQHKGKNPYKQIDDMPQYEGKIV